MGFSRQEYWNGFPFPHPGDLSHPGIKSPSPTSAALQAASLPLSHWGSPQYNIQNLKILKYMKMIIMLVQINSVMYNSRWPHGLQHARLPCPSPTPRVDSNSCPLSRWCRQTISSSLIPFSSCLQPFPVSGSLQMSQFFASGDKGLEFHLQHQSF